MPVLHYVSLAGCVLLCAVAFRIRGGLLANTSFQLPGQVSRLVFAASAGLTAWVAGVPWIIALSTVPAWWIDSTFPLFGGIDLGQRDGTEAGDFGALTLRGFLWGILPALVLLWPAGLLGHPEFGQGVTHWWAVIAAGLMMPLAYLAGRQSGAKLPGFGAIDWQQTAEGIYGAVLGLGVIGASL